MINMNDTTSNSETSLPMQIRYGLALPSALQNAEQTLNRFDSNNGSSFKMGSGSTEIRIPVSGTGFLLGSQNYLQFTLRNNETSSGKNIKLMNSAADVIEQLKIESNGVELSRVDGYNLLDSIKKNYTTKENQTTVGSFEGSNKPVIPSGSSSSQTFVLRLDEGFLGGGALRKAIPLSGTTGFVIIIRLAKESDAFVHVDGSNGALGAPIPSGSIVVENPRLYCPVFQVYDGNFAQRYNSMLSQFGIQWNGVTSKRYVGTTATGNGSQVIQLNDKSLSLRGFVSCIRPNSTGQDIFAKNVFATSIAEIETFKYNLMGEEYPQGGLDVDAKAPGRAFMENVKLFTDMVDPKTTVDFTSFTSAPTGAVTDQTKGTMAVCLLKYDDKNLKMAGMETAASTIPSTLEFRANTSGFTAQRLDTFAIVDSVYMLDQTGQFKSAY